MKKKHIFIAIILLAAALRLYKIGVIPYGYNWDETSINYNAWGISVWYRDEWAQKLPLAFKSFGDYKAPLMFYLLAAPFKLFGFYEPLIRIYSAISGVIVVIVTYFLSKEIFPKKSWAPELSAFLVAISPWAINFSRVGFEANLGLALVSVATLFLFKGIKKSNFWYLSSLFFALSIYAYHSTKIFVPIFLLCFVFIYKKQIFKNIKKSILAILFFSILISPIIYVTVFGSGFERGMTMIFFDNQHKLQPFLAIAKEFILNIKNQLSLDFLIKGKDGVGLRHLVPGFGIVYAIELPFLIVGFIKTAFSKKLKKRILSFWLVVGMLPAVLSHQTPHAVRSLLSMPALQIITASGFFFVVKKIQDKKISKYFITTTLLILMMLFIRYTHTYYTSYAKKSALSFQYGYKQALLSARERGKSKEKIIVTDKYGQPYIYVLLYNK
ncbi:glycosyltransferase family 39 protein, partial [Patescibacteria group bacterium]